MARPHRSPPARSARRALLLAAWIGLGGCAHWRGGQARTDEVRDAIAAANAEFARALVAGDARATAAVFTEDGQVISAARQGFVSGRAEIEAFNASRLEGRHYLEAVITTVGLGVDGDLAWETGTSRVTMQQGESPPVTVTGRYLAVWQRGPDGRWRIRADLPIADPPP